MKVRFHIDPETGEPQLHEHGVSEDEVEEVLEKPEEDRRSRDGARIAVGSTDAGRVLRVIYVPGPEPDGVFVITAYEPGAKALAAFRCRKRRRGR